jgi:hypothetical protein
VHAKNRYQSVDEFHRELVPQPPPLPPPPDARVFIVWWTVASTLMLAGSALRSDGSFWLFWAGLLPALISGRYVPILRSGGVRAILFVALALCAAVITAFTPFGALLLVAPLFAARPAHAASTGKILVARRRFALRCRTGQFAGNVLELGAAPIVIGRLPDQANVVISLSQISAAHARVWVDGGLWIEDLDSRNGTYIRRLASSTDWVKIHSRQQLSKGDRFYLCAEELAMFEVESADPA